MGAERLVVDLLLWLSYAIQVTGMDTYAIVASVLLQVITGFLGSSHPRLNSVACAAASQILSPCHSCHVLLHLFALAVLWILCQVLVPLAASILTTRGSMGLCQSQMTRTSVLRLNVYVQKWRSEQTEQRQSCFRNCKLKAETLQDRNQLMSRLES